MPKVVPFSSSLLRWYHQHKRNLPWRESSDPYHILVSEVMLQQTQVKTVIPYYKRFLKTFPTIESLAKAPLDTVLKHWEGLGYYSRARNLHALAGVVHEQHESKLPNQPELLQDLPGIGRYTAGAVLSIAFQQDFPVVDGNVQRVLSRYFGYSENIKTGEAQRWFWKTAASLLPKGQAGDFNQALMELGATVCTPRNPLCDDCPVRASCVARREETQDLLPMKSDAKRIPHHTIAAGVVRRGKKLLITQRPLKGMLGGLWEFPGGKLEAKETLEECVRREIMEEVGIEITVGKELSVVNHTYSHFRITIHFFECTYQSGEPTLRDCTNYKWVLPKQLKTFAFPKANQSTLELLTR